MDSEITEKLNIILDFYSIDLDRRGIEKDLTELLAQVYERGVEQGRRDTIIFGV